MRLIGIPFAVIGPIVTVIGLVSIRHEGLGGFGPGGRLGVFGYLFIGFAVVIVGWHWRSPRGLFRPAGQRRGWRLALPWLRLPACCSSASAWRWAS